VHATRSSEAGLRGDQFLDAGKVTFEHRDSRLPSEDKDLKWIWNQAGLSAGVDKLVFIGLNEPDTPAPTSDSSILFSMRSGLSVLCRAAFDPIHPGVAGSDLLIIKA
jgi:hypothetical protein